MYQRNFSSATDTAAQATGQNRARQIKSIAVLPFKIIGEGKDEKLGLGMADALISKLGNLQGVSVRPTSSIIRFTENEDEDLFETGRKLNVDAILIGTIQRDADLIRINVQLYDVSDQTLLAAEKFDEKYSNIFSIQDKISERIAQKLFLKTNSGEDPYAYLQYTNNIEAYQAYSIGLFHWNRRSEENLEKAVGYFRTAIEKDPKFAHAYAYLSDSYTLIGYYRMNLMPPGAALAKGREMANKALELDADCSEALTSLATIHSIEGDSEKAANLLQKAIENNPNNSTARVRLAWAYVYEGKLEKAVEEMTLAQSLDPLSKTTNLALAQLLYLARRPDESLIYSSRALEIDADSIEARRWIADAFEQKGMYREAVKQLDQALEIRKDDTFALLRLSRIYAKEKKFDESKRLLEKAQKMSGGVETSYLIALDYIALGRRGEAIKLLKKYRAESSGNYPHFKHDYQLDAVRGDPEFQKLLPPSDRNS